MIGRISSVLAASELDPWVTGLQNFGRQWTHQSHCTQQGISPSHAHIGPFLKLYRVLGPLPPVVQGCQQAARQGEGEHETSIFATFTALSSLLIIKQLLTIGASGSQPFGPALLQPHGVAAMAPRPSSQNSSLVAEIFNRIFRYSLLCKTTNYFDAVFVSLLSQCFG